MTPPDPEATLPPLEQLEHVLGQTDPSFTLEEAGALVEALEARVEIDEASAIFREHWADGRAVTSILLHVHSRRHRSNIDRRVHTDEALLLNDPALRELLLRYAARPRRGSDHVARFIEEEGADSSGELLDAFRARWTVADPALSPDERLEQVFETGGFCALPEVVEIAWARVDALEVYDEPSAELTRFLLDLHFTGYGPDLEPLDNVLDPTAGPEVLRGRVVPFDTTDAAANSHCIVWGEFGGSEGWLEVLAQYISGPNPNSRMAVFDGEVARVV